MISRAPDLSPPTNRLYARDYVPARIFSLSLSLFLSAVRALRPPLLLANGQNGRRARASARFGDCHELFMAGVSSYSSNVALLRTWQDTGKCR